MNGDIREFLNTVGKIGWTMVGYDGNNHLRLHHVATGHFHSVAFTPSDYRSRRNSLAILERLAGRKIPRFVGLFNPHGWEPAHWVCQRRSLRR